ncbi:MAG: hypothetical protein ABEJ95_05150 [Candidatus Nanohalobium sp.]
MTDYKEYAVNEEVLEELGLEPDDNSLVREECGVCNSEEPHYVEVFLEDKEDKYANEPCRYSACLQCGEEEKELVNYL